MLTIKIAGAEGGHLYDIRMECTAIIRKAARDLKVSIRSFKMFGFDDVEYFDKMRYLIANTTFFLSIGWPDSINGITISPPGDCLILPA
jgi:hypothetical protein